MNLEKYILYLPKKLQKTLLLAHRFQVIYNFAYSLMRYTNLFQTLIAAFINFSKIKFWKLNPIKKTVNLGGRI